MPLPQHQKYLIAILILGIIMRLILLTHIHGGLFEPDNYIYLSMAKQSLSQGQLPVIDSLSGFPIHNVYTEMPFLIGWATVPNSILKYIGFSLLSTMQLIPILFGLLGIMLVYLFTERITGSKNTALWAAFFFAVIPAAVYKTSAGEWRGETFVPILLALSLAFIALRKKSVWDDVPYLEILASLILLILASYTWNGGIFAIMVYLIFLAMILIDRLLKTKDKVLKITIGAIILVAIAWLLLPFLPILSKYSMPLTYLSFGASIQEVQQSSFLSLVASLVFLIPLVLFGIWYLFKEYEINEEKLPYYAMLAMLIVSIPLSLQETRWVALIAVPACIFGAIGIQYLIERRKNPKHLLAAIAIVSILASVYSFSIGIQPAGINQNEISAMNWISNNTAQNSTFLTLWQDGSLIEGVANRTSYTDSVVGLNGSKALNFSIFLFQPATNLSYLAKVNPDYLLIRYYWLNITYGLKLESPTLINKSINGTNLQLLEGFPLSVTGNGITLTRVFSNNGAAIYKVTGGSNTIYIVPSTATPQKTTIPTSSSTTTMPQSTTTLFTTSTVSLATTTTITTTTTIQQDGIINYNATLKIPNQNQGQGQSIFSYLPVMTTNSIEADYILAYAPISLISLQTGLLPYVNVQGFESPYTFNGQVQFANLGKEMLAANASLAIYEENAT